MSVAASLRPRGLLNKVRALSTASVTAVPSRAGYDIPRNSNGSLPVYTDVRNGGTRHLTLIRNVEGNAARLADAIQQNLFPAQSPEAARLRVRVQQNRHLILSGGRWKHSVVEWLAKEGF